ncbi:MAG: WG repeat-containing protein, partial [Planctomycetota bacterium]
LCRLLRNAPPFVSDKTPRTQLATRTAVIVFLVYVSLYYILSLFGSYVLPDSEKSKAVTHPTYQWQPKFIVNYKDYNEDKIITKANLLGQLYAPLLFIDQRYVHQSNVTTNSWVRWLGDTFIFGFKYGFIDKTGELVIPFQYDETHGFSEDMAPVQIEGNWGYIDRKGLMVIEPQFDYAQNFSEALAAVRDEDGKYGYIDKSGVYVIDPQFENANNFIDGLATVKDISGKYGQIDKTGQYVVEPKYDNSSYLSKALICNKLGDKFGFVNKNEELAIEHQYTYAQDFSEGLALVSKDCNGLDFRIFPNEPLSAGFIDTHGQVIINFQYDNAYSFSEGMAGIKTGGKWGFIDKSGEIVITPQFSMIRSFSEELAVVSIDHKQGYIDKSGKIAIEPQFDIASDFSEGLAPVAVKMTDGKSDKD